MFKAQYPNLVNSFVSVERLLEIENLPKEDEEKQTLLGVLGVDFSNVSFKYSNDARWIHESFYHTFKPGSVTAIVGEIGKEHAFVSYSCHIAPKFREYYFI